MRLFFDVVTQSFALSSLTLPRAPPGNLQYENDWQQFITSIPERQQMELEKARRTQFGKGRALTSMGMKIGFPVSCIDTDLGA